MQADLATRLAGLGRALRGHDVGVTISDQIDAARAHALVDTADRAEVQRALRVALKIRHGQEQTFERLFACFWAGSPYPERRSRAPSSPSSSRSASPGGRFPRWDPHSGTLAQDPPDRERPEGDTSGYSAEASLRRKALPSCSPEELAAMGRVLERLARRLATRRSRRLVPARRGLADPRRSFQRAIRNAGEFVSLARRARPVEIPRLVFVCDTSGSMEAHTRFLLSFVVALRRVAPRTEAFAFNTRLTRVTPWLSPDRLGPTLDRLSREVEDWGGGTRIGDCLAELVEAHADRLQGSRTVLLVLSDGLDRGDPERLRAAMRALRRRVRKLIWLNPLAADPHYEPAARGMDAALPFVDLFAAVRDLESLERLLPEMVI